MKSINEFKGALSNRAFNSMDTLGRRFKKDHDHIHNDVIDPFFFDREKIRLSNSFCRLSDKTQVFPRSLHKNVRDRLIHTNEVVKFASNHAYVLGLNVYLTEAMAYGHDIGHTPFGHLGETLICELSGKKFTHNVMSVVVAQKIEMKGLGLNLNYETLEGILHHSRGSGEMSIASNITEEANLVMFADKISYTFSDLNDALEIGYISNKKLPKVVKFFGKDPLNKVSFEFLKESAEQGRVSFSKSETSKHFNELRQWMYDNVYYVLDIEEYRTRIFSNMKLIVSFLHDHFNDQVDPYLTISCMTDSEVTKLSACLNNGGVKDMNYGFVEIINNFIGKKINIFSADLNKKDFIYKP